MAASKNFNDSFDKRTRQKPRTGDWEGNVDPKRKRLRRQ